LAAEVVVVEKENKVLEEKRLIAEVALIKIIFYKRFRKYGLFL
jgi:hypothetical protein